MEIAPFQRRNPATHAAHDVLSRGIDSSVSYPPLEAVTRPAVTTGEAAFYLNRQPQTLRGWACQENGPIRPRRVGGRLAWDVSELKRLLGVTA